MTLEQWEKYYEKYETIDREKLANCTFLFDEEKGFLYYEIVNNAMYVKAMSTTDYKYWVDRMKKICYSLGLTQGFSYRANNPFAYAKLFGCKIRFDLSGKAENNNEWCFEFPLYVYKRAYIITTSLCNLSCKYCSQGQEKCEVMPNVINEELFEFLERQMVTEIVYYGGEPLLAWDKIVYAVKKMPNMKHSIITNGKLLTQDKVDFINKYDIGVAISHDGEHTILTRGYDVLETKLNLVKQINKKMINSVLTKYTQDIEKVYKYYDDLFGEYIYVNFEFINSTNKDMIDIDFDVIRKNAIHISQEAIKHWEDTRNLDRHVFDIVSHVDMLQNRPNWYNTPCGHGATTIDIDFAGNIYECHNKFTRLGDIDSYEHIGYEHPYILCTNCPLFSCCHARCDIQKNPKALNVLCKLTKAFYGPIVSMLEYMKERKNESKD